VNNRVPILVVVVGSLLAGCGSDEEADEVTRFDRALETVGLQVSPDGTGYGWVDVRELRDGEGRQAAIAAASALGPGADEMFQDRRSLERSTGIRPLEADEALSVGGSYTFAVRLDGASPGRLPALLERAGSRRERIAGWTAFDLGAQAQAPTSGRLSVLSAFASRTAVAHRSTILARTDATRRSLIGGDGSVLDDPAIEFASECLGEASAARIVPGTFTHSPAASPDLFAFGTEMTEPAREVLCTIDDSADEAEQRAAAMQAAFAPDARDSVTGERIGRWVATANVDSLADGELQAARARLTLTRSALLDAFARGSLATYTGVGEPVPDQR
jgi:hypothetical protein